MRKKKGIVATLVIASILTINSIPAYAAEVNCNAVSEKEVFQSERMAKPEKITKSVFMEEVQNIKAEFPEANINTKLAEIEFDNATEKQASSNLTDIMSDISKKPKEVYQKIKDDGSTLTLKVYSASSWETTTVSLGSRSGNYYTGTKCEVRYINNCTTLGLSFRVDHTTSHVDRTYNLFVIGWPDMATGIGVSIYSGSGSSSKIYVTGHDLNSGYQLFHGMVVFQARGFSLSTSYVWD